MIVILNNKYDDKKIGARIRQARKDTRGKSGRPLSLEKVAEICGPTRQLISKWEHGDISSLSLGDLTAMSNLFQCDVTFLLGEHETKRRATVDVQKETGLSTGAIEKIADMNRFSAIPVEVLSKIILQPDGMEFFQKIFELAQLKSANKYLKNMQESFKLSNNHAKRIASDGAIEEVTYKEKAKNAVILELFNNILDGITDELMNTPDVFEQGRRIAQRALDPDEELAFRKWVFAEVDKMVSEEDKQNG